MPRFPSWFPFVVCAVLSAGCAAQLSGMEPAGPAGPTVAVVESIDVAPTVNSREGIDARGVGKVRTPGPRVTPSPGASLAPAASFAPIAPVELDDPAPNDPSPSAPSRDERPSPVAVPLGEGSVEDPSGQIYREHRRALAACIGELSPEVSGQLLVRVHVTPAAEVTAVTISWHLGALDLLEAVPDSLERYGEAVECIEDVLLDASAPEVDPGDHALHLELAPRPRGLTFIFHGPSGAGGSGSSAGGNTTGGW